MIAQERRDLAMIAGSRGRWANKKNLLSECGLFLLEPKQAESRIDTMAEVVKKEWYAKMRHAGVSESDCEKLRPAFIYDGFWTE
jgi:serine/threonine-protein kinase HipA